MATKEELLIALGNILYRNSAGEYHSIYQDWIDYRECLGLSVTKELDAYKDKGDIENG